SCVLAGHSFAGVIAVEVARRFQAQGGQVDAVILFDSYAKMPSFLDRVRYFNQLAKERILPEKSGAFSFGRLVADLTRQALFCWLVAKHVRRQIWSSPTSWIRLLLKKKTVLTSILDEDGVPVDGGLILRLDLNVLKKYQPRSLNARGV